MLDLIFIDLLANTVDSGISYNLKLLNTYLGKANLKSSILDWNTIFPERISPNEAAEKILSFGPKIVAFSAVTCNFFDALIISKTIKELHPDVKILFGGPHASIIANKLLHRFAWIDAVSIGESERKIVILVKNILSGEYQNLSALKGLVLRKPDGSLFEDYTCDVLFDLDSLPHLDYSDNLSRATPSIYIETARGCYGKCIYCSTSLFWAKNGIRYRKVSDVLGQIEEILFKFTPPSNTIFYLTHDNFTQNRKWLHNFLKGASALKGTTPNFKWTCSSKPDAIDFETINQMKLAGCNRIFCGFETGSPFVQSRINKKIDLTKSLANVTYASGQGIQVVASFIIGFPFESKTDIDETLKMALNLRLHNCSLQFHRLALLPGTSIFADFALSDDFSYSDVSLYGDSAISRLQLTSDAVNDFIRKNADMMPYYFAPKNEHGLSSDFISFLDHVASNFMLNHYPMSIHIFSDKACGSLWDFFYEFHMYLTTQQVSLDFVQGFRAESDNSKKLHILNRFGEVFTQFMEHKGIQHKFFNTVFHTEDLRLRKQVCIP